jgi:hypothetical protein
MASIYAYGASCAIESVTEESFWGNEAREFQALQSRAWMTENLNQQKTKYSGGQTPYERLLARPNSEFSIEEKTKERPFKICA